MTNEEKDKIKDKWDPIINSMGLTGSKADWMVEYDQFQQDKESKITENTLASEGTTSDFPSFLPIAMRVAARTIGQDIVTVQPMDISNSREEFERMKNEVKAENRERKIDSLIEDKEFQEMSVEEHPDYKASPRAELLYLDYHYGATSS
jgi:hypothetical protein